MKKKILGSKARKVILAFYCLILAILFWFVITYLRIDELPIISLIFS